MRRKMLVATLFLVMLMMFGRSREQVPMQMHAAGASHAQEDVRWDPQEENGGFDVEAFLVLSVIAGVVFWIVIRTSPKSSEELRFRK